MAKKTVRISIDRCKYPQVQGKPRPQIKAGAPGKAKYSK